MYGSVGGCDIRECGWGVMYGSVGGCDVWECG